MVSAGRCGGWRHDRCCAALLLAWLLAWPALVLAQDPFAGPDFLPVDQAFELSAVVDEGRVALRWRIAEDYYLYRHQLDFSLHEGADGALEVVSLPDGQPYTDEYFGDVEVYYRQLEVVLRVDEAAETLVVRYQGCADAGLCYPPEQRYVALQGAAAGDVSQGPPGADGDGRSGRGAAAPDGAAGGSSSPVTEEGRLAALLSADRMGLALLLFFLAGLGLTFTPCVLPMVPILASLIAGQGSIGRGRATVLSLSYVLPMALTYALMGVLVGYFGGALNLQGWLQSPAVLLTFALLFVALALAMFGVWTLQAPAFLRDRLTVAGGGGNVGSVALMGALSSILVSPCISAPLAGALIYIGSSGDALLGGTALFALGLGMGVPLLAVGIGGASLLPRVGPWMNGVRAAFGVLLLAVAVWLLERLLPGAAVLALWSALAVGSGVALGALDARPRQGGLVVLRVLGVMLLLYGVLLLIGAASGGSDPLRPLAPLAERGGETRRSVPEFMAVDSLSELRTQLQAAREPVLLEFYADWCISCKVMERNVFPAPEVRERLGQFRLLRADITASTAADRELLQHYGLFGPPSMLFFSNDEGAGVRELRRYRLQGELGREALAEHLGRVLAASGRG